MLALLHPADARHAVDLLRHLLTGPAQRDVRVASAGVTGFPEWRSLDEWWRITETGWFDEALTGNLFTTWFQPVVDTSLDGVLGYECLARVRTPAAHDDRQSSGRDILEAARLRGEERSLDRHLREVAVWSAAAFSPQSVFFINFLPQFIFEPDRCLSDTFAAISKCRLPAARVVFEAVNAAAVQPQHLSAIAEAVRGRGCGISLDDVSISNGGLQLIYGLCPDYVKLAGELMLDIEAPACATAIRRLVEAADRTGTTVVAKNVEDVAMMENLWLLGVQVMQGNYFASPAPAPALGSADLINLISALDRPEICQPLRN